MFTPLEDSQKRTVKSAALCFRALIECGAARERAFRTDILSNSGKWQMRQPLFCVFLTSAE